MLTLTTLSIIFIFVWSVVSTTSTPTPEWHYKFTYTSSINSQMSLECGGGNAIWIGWSHYGTRNSIIKRNEKSREHQTNPFSNDRVLNFPNEKDCWMNFTEKIAEQCNGAEHCDLSAQPTYIHKCGKISDYLYVSFQCIPASSTRDICRTSTRTFKSNSKFFIKSSDFPDEYPSSLDCSCSITTSIPMPLKLEFLWFSLQDNDYLQMFNKNLTGWINPTYEMPILTKTNKIRFLTDDSLAYKGFWLKIAPRRACQNDWQLVGDNCIKVFTEPLNWRSANKRCQQMSGNLLKVNDVVADLKLTQYMKSFHPDVVSYWIGLRKYVDAYNKERWMWSLNSTNYDDISWWPWIPRSGGGQQKSSDDLLGGYANNCVVKKRSEDGYFTTSCGSENMNAFICQTKTLDTVMGGSDIRLHCGETNEVEADLIELAKFEAIGASSIKNYQTKEKSTTESAILIHQFNEPELEIINPVMTTLKSELPRHLLSTTHETRLASSIQDLSTQWNTAMLAGIIAAIGMVIVLINLAVLFLCRRNLKKFLKSNKDPKNGTKLDQAPTSEMLQDYFEAFSTLHNLHTKPNLLSPGGQSKAQAKIINDINTFTLNHKQHLMTLQQKSGGNGNSTIPNRTMGSSGSDNENESAKLFYNSQQFFKNLTMKQTSDALGNSAFKPFIRNELNDPTLPMENLLPNRNQFIQANANQYDKISHIQPNPNANFENQYAHTYECLDNNNSGNVNNELIRANNNHMLGSPNFDPQFNVSTSSTSSSSGASSTQHLIRHQNVSDSSNANQINIEAMLGHQLQSLTPAQLHSLLSQNQHQMVFKCVCGASSLGDVCNVCGCTGRGSWSPDSAYYSQIPMAANYGGGYNMSMNMGHCNNNGSSNSQMMVPGGGQQQFSSFNFNSNHNGENFKSHLV